MEEGTVVKEYVHNPITYRAEQYDGSAEQDTAIAKLLEDAKKIRAYTHGVIEKSPGPYHEVGYVENGPKVRLWEGEWVLVSSVGEMTVESDADFKKGFSEK